MKILTNLRNPKFERVVNSKRSDFSLVYRKVTYETITRY